MAQLNDLLLLKLGGSLITDKTINEGLRRDELHRIASETARALAAQPAGRAVVLAHGSGSFGHVPAREFETHLGRLSARRGSEWQRGLALVARAAAKLNGIVLDALVAAGVPAMAFAPRSVVCRDGRVDAVCDLAAAVRLALQSGVVPLLNGDAVLDSVRACTILPTEAIFAALLADAAFCGASGWILCAGETDGVLTAAGATVRRITRASFGGALDAALTSESRGGAADVSGAMRGKVLWLLDVVERHAAVRALIFNGLVPGNVEQALRDPLAVANATIVENDEQEQE